MFTKSLIALQILGLVLLFGGEVFSAETAGPGPDPRPVQLDLTDMPPNAYPVAVGQPVQTLQKGPATLGASACAIGPYDFPPPEHICEYVDYSDGNVCNYVSLPGDYEAVSTRFTNESGSPSTLGTVYIRVYVESYDPSAKPLVRAEVYADDGSGSPGILLRASTLPDFPMAVGFFVLPIPFCGAVIEAGADFHVVITNAGDGELRISYDDLTNPLGRSYTKSGGSWSLLEGGDGNFNIGLDFCDAECYCQSYYCSMGYGFQLPGTFGDYFNMRMSVEVPETLKAVSVAFYEPFTVGTPDLEVFVWGSSGGFPDESNIIFTTTVPYSQIQYLPIWNRIPMPGNIVLRSDFHVGFSATGGSLGLLADDGSCGTGRSSSKTASGWQLMADISGAGDVNFFINAELCKDKPHCPTVSDYCGFSNRWIIPALGFTGVFQKVSPINGECLLDRVRIALNSNMWGWLDLYEYPSEIQIWSSDPATGLPAVKLAGVDVPVANYVFYPMWVEVDVAHLGIAFTEDIWVGIESLDPLVEDIVVLTDDGCCGNRRSCGIRDGTFMYMDDFWGEDFNFLIEADICYYRPEERHCGAGGAYGGTRAWETAAHDFRRSGASDHCTCNAKCEQELLWWNTEAGTYGSRPIIYDDMVIVPYEHVLKAFDINTGSAIWFLGFPWFEYIGSSFRNSVTVKDGYVYFGGGTEPSFSRADVYTATVDWSRNDDTDPIDGMTVYTTSVILDCGGTDVVFFGTQTGKLYALEAATGNNFAGWSVNPRQLDGDPRNTLSSNDGNIIYVATDGDNSSLPGNGTLYAINACTGDILWQLGNPDLYGDEITKLADPGEVFSGPIAVDLDGSLYVMTRLEKADMCTVSGVLYKIDASGTIVWHRPGKLPLLSGPVIDADKVYFTTQRRWTSENTSVVALDKGNGAFVWNSDPTRNALNIVEGALSCEEGAPDLLYVGNMEGSLLAINTGDGSIEFEYNYVGFSDEVGGGVAMDESHVVFSTSGGNLFCFAPAARGDRPRLRILTFDDAKPVPFFSPPSYMVTFEDVFVNNGCANLTGTLTAEGGPPAAYAWTVNPERVKRMQEVADDLVNVKYSELARTLVRCQAVDVPSLDSLFVQSAYAKDSYSDATAYGPPAWLNGIVTPDFDLAPDETMDVVFDVNGPLVSRGPHSCYITIASNDDYFLNSADDPVVQLGVIGGCLESFDYLVFGAGEQNTAPVFNTGRIASPYGVPWEIDDTNGFLWQGGLFYAAGMYRLAWAGESWEFVGTDNFWSSLLPDPNCFGQCEPYVTPAPVVLGQMSHDGGVSYDDVYGYASASAYIDSVVNFDCHGTGWDWTNVDCPYDNSLTLGLRIDEFMYGVIGEPPLNNVVIFKLDVANRNPGLIEDVFIGALQDYNLEVLGSDQWLFDAVHSVARGASCLAGDVTSTGVYGMGKVPMGVDPMVGVRTLDAGQSMNHPEYIGLDSLYHWMANMPGASYQAGIDPSFPCDPPSEDDDRHALFSFVGHDFAGNEIYTLGFFMFGFNTADVLDNAYYAELAVLVNQFCGFERGDVDDDGVINLADAVALWRLVNADGPGPRFPHLADVNADGVVDNGDVLYLANFYFCAGDAPVGEWVLPNICP